MINEYTIVQEHSRVALTTLVRLRRTPMDSIAPGADTLSRWAATPGGAAWLRYYAWDNTLSRWAATPGGDAWYGWTLLIRVLTDYTHATLSTFSRPR